MILHIFYGIYLVVLHTKISTDEKNHYFPILMPFYGCMEP